MISCGDVRLRGLYWSPLLFLFRANLPDVKT